MCTSCKNDINTRAEFYDVVCDCVRGENPTPGVCAMCKDPLGFDEHSLCGLCENGLST